MISEPTATIVKNAILHWQKLAMALAVMIVLLIVGFPVFYIGIQWAQQMGKLPSVYSQEHEKIMASQEVMKGMMVALTGTTAALTQQVATGNNVSDDIAFFLQTICVNQANTKEVRDKCLVPKWRRNLEVKPQ